ncbi:olfactory receptor 13 [Bombyx mori]|uniref:Odorant receptor n=1 Tax=Bombyx mori TaxID=7091 RepID=C4B7U6_BOMMO|nr:olfactory receptor 13 [Bombyx mori]BAH66312.1 olfactory receptor [Bombyx mori]
MAPKQIDCFEINWKFWKFLGIWSENKPHRYYKYYSKIFITFFVILYDVLYTINFYFVPRQLDLIIGEMLFYLTELSVLSKVFTFIIMRHKLKIIFEILESDAFQTDTEEELKILHRAKVFIKRYWKIVALVSITANLTHISSPLLKNLIFKVELVLPVCSYSFLSESFLKTFEYPLYFYQIVGIHFHMLYNLNIDTYFLGLMILIIAQLDILNVKFRNLKSGKDHTQLNESIMGLNKNLDHYNEIERFCSLVQNIFSFTLFVQFSMASCIICVCLFSFTLSVPVEYYIFLATYMFIMIIQIMVPCWFGSRIMDKSILLSSAIYNCDWTSNSKDFKINMRLFVERANKPLSITGGKMFSLSLATFTSIMNSAYSFFTLLRYIQTRE